MLSMINGSAQRSIGLTRESMPDRAEVHSAIVQCCTRVVPLRTVNEKLNRDCDAGRDQLASAPSPAGPWRYAPDPVTKKKKEKLKERRKIFLFSLSHLWDEMLGYRLESLNQSNDKRYRGGHVIE
jgi:hypothetical protein